MLRPRTFAIATALVTSLAAVAGTAHAQGYPVIDNTELVKTIEVVKNTAQQLQQLTSIFQTVTQLKDALGKHAPNTAIATRLITLELPHPKRQPPPRDGWTNYATWGTALVIDNNDEQLREQAIWGHDKNTLPTIDAIERRLTSQRPQWVAHRAPWIAAEINVREIAHHLAEIARERYAYAHGDEVLPADPELEEEAPRDALPLFAFAAKAGKAA
jgi:hypothetical protein